MIELCTSISNTLTHIWKTAVLNITPLIITAISLSVCSVSAAEFTWSSYFLSLSQTVMAEGWAPLWGGEGLWLARFRDCGGLRLSLSPRLWLPLLRRLRLAPCRELDRDLPWKKKKDMSALWIIIKKTQKKPAYRGRRVKPRSSVWRVSSPVSVPISGPVSVVGPRSRPLAPPSGSSPSPASRVWPRASPWPRARSRPPAVPPSTSVSVMPWAGRQARGGPRWGTGGRGTTGGRPSSPGQTETSRFSNKASPAPILPSCRFKDSYSHMLHLLRYMIIISEFRHIVFMRSVKSLSTT